MEFELVPLYCQANKFNTNFNCFFQAAKKYGTGQTLTLHIKLPPNLDSKLNKFNHIKKVLVPPKLLKDSDSIHSYYLIAKLSGISLRNPLDKRPIQTFMRRLYIVQII